MWVIRASSSLQLVDGAMDEMVEITDGKSQWKLHWLITAFTSMPAIAFALWIILGSSGAPAQNSASSAILGYFLVGCVAVYIAISSVVMKLMAPRVAARVVLLHVALISAMGLIAFL